MPRRQLAEILVDSQAGVPALLRMKLGGYQVALSVDTAKGDPILGDPDPPRRFGGNGIIAVDEIKVAILGNALKRGMVTLEPNAVPAHVGYFQARG